MKRLIPYLTCMALLFAVAMGIVSCSDMGADVEETQYGTYLKVTVRVTGDASFGGTRAGGPHGGETGDGTEAGRGNENKVDNVTLLLYRDKDGINGNPNTVMDFALFAPAMYEVDGSQGRVYTSDILCYKSALPRGTYHVIALVNMGDRTNLEGKTLAEVRDMKMPAPYTMTYDPVSGMPDVDGAANFAMTSAMDITFTLGDISGLDHPVQLQIPVERLAARIDFSPGKLGTVADGTNAAWVDLADAPVEGGGTMSMRGYMYAVLNGATKEVTNDRFVLTGVTPFNGLTSGTYFIKRVVNELEGGGTETVYLGKETTNVDANATNYVLDPWTAGKNTATDPAGLGYRNRLTNASDLLGCLWPVKPEGDMFVPSIGVAGLKYYILDYTQENTLLPGHGKERYATGLLITGYYGSANTDGTIEKYLPQNYYYYIRHADPTNSSDESLPMKYGIVRNNIYRININSVNSLGQIQIVVNDWKRIDVPEIQI